MLFEERLPPSFLDLPPDDELSAVSDIEVSGRAYQASEWVLVEGQVKASLRLPCSMCNEMCDVSVALTPWEASVSAEAIKEGIVDLSDELREAILIEVPFFVRCGGDVCRHIDDIKQYLAISGPDDQEDETYQPFRALLQEI